MVYNIVSTHNLRKVVSKLDDYRLDLGLSFSNRSEIIGVTDINVQDDFVSEFLSEHNILAYKVGILGAINFYTSDTLKDDRIFISNTNKSLWYDISKEDMRLMVTDTLSFIGKIIYNFENGDADISSSSSSKAF